MRFKSSENTAIEKSQHVCAYDARQSVASSDDSVQYTYLLLPKTHNWTHYFLLNKLLYMGKYMLSTSDSEVTDDNDASDKDDIAK